MAGAGAEIMDKGGTEKEREPKINNFGSATLQLFIALPTTYESTLLIVGFIKKTGSGSTTLSKNMNI